jgi:hypothetical protein
VTETTPIRLRADFNGLFSQLLCLSHDETCVGEDAQNVRVHEGMTVTAFDEDVDDEGKPDNLVASGTVKRSPNWLSCEVHGGCLESTRTASGTNLTYDRRRDVEQNHLIDLQPD